MGQLRILSRDSRPFRDRREAGRLLAAELEEYSDGDTVVLGIPRGGVVVARELARSLEAELDIVLAHKLPAPGHEELAMGSVAEDGRVFLNREIIETLEIPEYRIAQEKERQMAEMRRRTGLFRRARPKAHLSGRVVIVTDDGVATGATTQAAIWAARLEKPGRLVAAIPVGAEETLERLAADIDEVLCLRSPPMFAAVGQFYMTFNPVEDREVMEIMGEKAGSS